MLTDSSCRPLLSRSPPASLPRVAGAPGTTNFRRGQSSPRFILIGIGLAPGKDSWWHHQLPALSFVGWRSSGTQRRLHLGVCSPSLLSSSLGQVGLYSFLRADRGPTCE